MCAPLRLLPKLDGADGKLADDITYRGPQTKADPGQSEHDERGVEDGEGTAHALDREQGKGGREANGEKEDGDCAEDVHHVREERQQDGEGVRQNEDKRGDKPPAQRLEVSALPAVEEARPQSVHHVLCNDNGVDGVGDRHVDEEAYVGEYAHTVVGQVQRDGRLDAGAKCGIPDRPTTAGRKSVVAARGQRRRPLSQRWHYNALALAGKQIRGGEGVVPGK